MTPVNFSPWKANLLGNIFPFFSRLITTAFENSENVECPWGVETRMVLLLGAVNVVQVLFRVKQLFGATPIPVTSTGATSTPMTGTAATQTPVMGDAVEPED